MNNNETHILALTNLIKKVGSQERLADILTKNGLTIGQAGISHWINRKKVSIAGAILIEKIFNKPSFDDLRPKTKDVA